MDKDAAARWRASVQGIDAETWREAAASWERERWPLGQQLLDASAADWPTQPQAPLPAPAPRPRDKTALATAAVVLALVGLLVPPLGVVSLVLGLAVVNGWQLARPAGYQLGVVAVVLSILEVLLTAAAASFLIAGPGGAR